MSDQQVSYTLSLKDLFTSGIKNADGAVNKLEGSIGKVTGALGPLAAAAGLAFSVAGIMSFGKAVLDAGSKVEDATTGLTTLLKDGNAARQVIKDTMEDATKTPFAFEGLLMANKALIAANVSAKDARSTVLDLANAIAATGGGDDELSRMVVNLQQIRNTGTATAADIKQFAFAGINVYEALAKATGKNADQVKGMNVSYEMLTGALRKAHEAGGIYANGLENMAGNTSVQISNLGDALFQLKVQMFNDLKPLISGAVGMLSNFISKLRTGWEWIMAHADTFRQIGNFVKPLWDAIVKYYGIIWEGLQEVFSSLLQFKEPLLEWWATLRDAIIAVIEYIGPAVGAVFKLIAGIIDVIHTIYVFWEKMGVIGLIKNMFVELWEAVLAFGKAVSWVYDNFVSPIVDKILEAYNLVKKLLGISDGGVNVNATATTKAILYQPPDTVRSVKPAGGIKAGGGSGSTDVSNSKASSVSGQKSVTINIQIGSLIKEFSVKSTTVTEGFGKMKDMVTQTLLGAVNDSQIIAGQ